MTEEFSPFELLKRVDAAVAKVSKKWGKRLPGLTVALSKDGKLVLARGYGSKGNGAMTAHSRSAIGSTTKAVVTGPAAWGLLGAQKPPVDSARRLYGPDGLFEGAYDKDALIGARRHSPIIDVAISPDDKVYAWYVDGTVSVGDTADLDRHEPPRPFKLPPGKTVHDIIGIGISKDSRVWVWYDDATCSIGSSTDLDAVGWREEEVDGKLQPATFKRAKGVDGGAQPVSAIVGIDIAKSNDHIYVWYEDGSVSSGTSMDFGYYFDCKPFTCAALAGGSPLEIRGVGIAADDVVYAWFGNGMVSSGKSTALAERREPYAYKLPALAPDIDRWEWFKDITLQHLLDHKAGFAGGGEIEKAARMFKVDDEALSYDQLHRHFLRTHKLLSAPGTKEAYSNHGMGLWTLIIERLSGQRFRDHVRERYLEPNGLEKLLTPRTDPPDGDVSKDHEVPADGGAAVVKTFASGEIELGAGGYRASARGLVLAMLKLSARYKDDQPTLDRMGWKNDKGRLYHYGSTGGGVSAASMYPSGHTIDGVNLSRVHTAVAANVSDTVHADGEKLSGDLIELSKTIAALVHASTEPVGCKALHHKITELTAALGDAESTLADLEDYQDPDGPVVKPPSGDKQALKAKIAKLRQELAAELARADGMGCAVGYSGTAASIADGVG